MWSRRAPRGKGGGKGDSGGKEESALKKAERLKADFVQCIAAATALIRSIVTDQDEDLSWANNNVTLGPIKNALHEAERVMPEYNWLMASPLKEIEKDMVPEDFNIEISNFINGAGPAVSALKAEHKEIMAMQQARKSREFRSYACPSMCSQMQHLSQHVSQHVPVDRSTCSQHLPVDRSLRCIRYAPTHAF